MIIYKIKANEALFHKWRSLGAKFHLLGDIVQNDVELEHHDVAEWLEYCRRLIEEAEILSTETSRYINET